MIYLASPYSHPDPAIREARFQAVCIVCGVIMQRGLHVFSPIAHTHSIAIHSKLPTGFDLWRDFDHWFLSRVDELWVLMLPGWDGSTGVTAEILMARDLDKPVKYIIPSEYLTSEGEELASL